MKSLGLRRPRQGFLVGISVGLLVGIGAVILGTLINALSTVVFERLGYSTESRVQRELMQTLEGWIQSNPALAIPAIVFVLVILTPFAEELVFRGAVFNGFYRLVRLTTAKAGATKDADKDAAKEAGTAVEVVAFTFAAIASSVVFALLHLEPVLLPMLLILAVILCGLFRWSGSILPSVVTHAVFNSLATTVIILSGLGVFELPV